MPAFGPGDPPPVVVRRRRKARRRPTRNQTAAAAENARQVATGKVRPNRPTKPISAVAPKFKPPVGDTKSDADLKRGDRQRQRDAVRDLPSRGGGGGDFDVSQRPSANAPAADAAAAVTAKRIGHEITIEPDNHYYANIKRKLLPDRKVPVDPFTGKVDYSYQRSPSHQKVQEASDPIKTSGLKVLEQTTRPVHAIAGAAKEDVKVVQEKGLGTYLREGGGKPALHAASRGIQNKDHVTFSNVLKQAGVKNKIARGAGGFVLDVVLDPTTYLTGGVGGVSKKAAAQAAEMAAKAGADEATVAAIRNRVGKTAEEHAAQHLEQRGRGLQIGLRFHVPFTDITAHPVGTVPGTRAVGHSAPVRAVRRKVRESRPVQAVARGIVPDFRPAGVAPAEHAAVRAAGRRHRAAEGAAEQRATRTKRALRRAVRKPEEQADVIAAVERAPVAPITDVELRSVRTPAYENKLVERKARRDVETARRREASVRGRADLETRQQSQVTLKNAHAEARRVADEIKKGNAVAPHLQDAAVITDNFRSATRARSKASTELTRANKAFRNAHVGARSLHSDAERMAATARLDAAKKASDLAKSDYKIAAAEIKSFAERAAGKAAGGQSPVSVLRHLDRQNPRTLNRLEKKRAALAQAETELAAAKAAGREIRKGAKTFGKFETVAVERSSGRRVSDINKNLPRITPESLKKHGDVARQVEAVNRQLHEAEVTAGVRRADSAKENYFPHTHKATITPKDAQPTKARRKGKAFGADKRRKVEGTIRELAARETAGTGVNPFTEDLGAAMASRIERSGKKIAKAEFTKELAKTGRKLRKAVVDEGYGAYIHDGTTLKKLEKTDGSPDLTAIETAIRQGKDVRQLNTKLIDPQLNRLEHARTSNAADAIMRGWKYSVTQVLPSYHIGNLIGDTVLAHEADTSASAYAKATKVTKARNRMGRHEASAGGAQGIPHIEGGTIKIGRIRMKIADLIAEMEREGAIQTGAVGRELHDLGGGTGVDSRSVRKPFKGEVGRRVTGFSEARENLPRIATYISARSRGLKPSEAAEWTNKHHIDYGDLTDFEQAIRRYAIPFYTFNARNARIQGAKLITRPGKAANFQKIREEAIKAAGLDPATFDDDLKDYQQRGAPLPLPFKKVLLLTPKTPIEQGMSFWPNAHMANGFPHVDMYDFAKRLINATGPIKLLFELPLKYSFFFNDSIESKDNNTLLQRAPDWVAGLDGVVGKAGGDYARSVLGIRKGADGWYWPGRLDYLVKSLPETKTALDLTTKGANRTGRTQGQTALGIAGIKLDPYKPPADREIDRLFAQRTTLQDKINRMQKLNTDRTADRSKYTPAYAALLKQQRELQKKIDAKRKARGDKLDPRVKRPRKPRVPNLGGGLGGGLGDSGLGGGLGGG